MQKTFKQRLGKAYIALTVGLTVLVLSIGKYYIHTLELDFIVLNTLIGSIISSSIFITGFLLAGVFADYKEVDKIPSEIRASLESILAEGRALRRKDENFNVSAMEGVIQKFVKEFEYGLSDTHDHSHMDLALVAISEFDPIFDDMEARGVPANYMTRIKTEQSQLRKMLLRVYHIQKTNFIPSVTVLVESIVLVVILLLLFVKSDLYEGMIEFALLSYLLIYTMRLINVLEKPFRKGKDDTCDDVSIFLLRELQDGLKNK